MEYKINFGIGDTVGLKHTETQEYKLVVFQKPGTQNPAWCAPSPSVPPTWIDFDANSLYKGGYKAGGRFVPIQLLDASDLGPSSLEALPLAERDGSEKGKAD